MKLFYSIASLAVIALYISCNTSDSGQPNGNGTTAANKNVTTLAQGDICEGIDNIDLCDNAGGTANLIIADTEALLMMNDFIAQYRRDDLKKPVHSLDSSYWVQKQVWLDIANFLRTTLNPAGKPKYDGIRIYMTCELQPDAGSYPGEQYQHKSGIVFFPTYYSYTPDLKVSDHRDDLVKIKLSGTLTSDYIQDAAVANPKIAKFDEVYRRMKMPLPRQKDNFSKSIWIDACIIFTLEKLLKLPNANLDGVNLNLAAYHKYDPARVPSMLYGNQSTMLLIPSSLAGGKHINNWAVLNCLVAHYVKIYLAPPPGGLNHGELCPQVCE